MKEIVFSADFIKAVLIASAVCIFTGSLILRSVGSSDEYKHIGFGRMVLFSMLLVIVPPSLFLTVASAWLHFLDDRAVVIGLSLGVVLWWFSARTIFSGLFEAFEGSPEMILFFYYLIYVGVIIFAYKAKF